MDEQKKTEVVEACAICAWRADCKKKFSLSGKNIRCPDFVKDLTIKDTEKKAQKHPEESG
ncbi:MAG: hypothetical protein D6778_01200 [Nitrospirae bacterium]|nr:MAG: hypothetical protein D6778_01200 [Nitrospirota bacterium]